MRTASTASEVAPPRRRVWRWLALAVGGLLATVGALIVLLPVDGTEQGLSCGGAPAVAAAAGIDTAADGDGHACRAEARSNVAGGMLVLLLPGVLLLGSQLARRRSGPAAPGPDDRSRTPLDREPVDRPPASRATPGLGRRSPADAAPSDATPDGPMALYLRPTTTAWMLLFAPALFLMPPLMWVAARAGRLGLRRQPVLTLDDSGLTDHRYGVVLPWHLVRRVTRVGTGRYQGIAVEVSELRALRPPWRLGPAMRWLAFRMTNGRRLVRLPTWGIDGVEAFVDAAAARVGPHRDRLPDRLVAYRPSWWLAGLPGGAGIFVLALHIYLDPEGWDGADLGVLAVGGLILLWRGGAALRTRPVLVLDRDGLIHRRRPRLRLRWDEVASVALALHGGPDEKDRLVVQLTSAAPTTDPLPDGGQHATRSLPLEGLSAPSHEIARVAEHLHARARGRLIADEGETVDARPRPLAAVAAVAAALAVGVVGWTTRPSPEVALRPGDCYAWVHKFERAERAGCTDPHDLEIYRVLVHPADAGAIFPGDGSLREWASRRCDHGFMTYVGQPETADDGLTYTVWLPTPAQWDDGGRDVACMVASDRAGRLTSPARAD